ncbi:response regulator, partial [Candidatus Dojkabacteria bacterium]|nr:response regulator [Candidatus Dojkabacteria bacterium]
MAKILIVDDSIVEIKILESILADTGHRIVVARNGEEAEKTAKVILP